MTNKTPNTIVSAIEDVKNNIFSTLKCLNIGIIDEFYPDTQTADVIMLQNMSIGDLTIPSTVIADAPVFIYGSKDAQIRLPELKGTICLILTFDRNIDSFMETGEAYTPETFRMHNITDSIVLPTMFSFNNSLTDYDTNALTIEHKKEQDTSYIKTFANAIESKVFTGAEYSQIGQTVNSIVTNVVGDEDNTNVTQDTHSITATVTGDESDTSIAQDTNSINMSVDGDESGTTYAQDTNSVSINIDDTVDVSMTINNQKFETTVDGLSTSMISQKENIIELLATKLTLHSTTDDLGLILTDLIDVVIGLKTTGNETLNNDTINALNAVKARVGGLL